jgi:mono/diheme cytochrome c family protein
MGIKQVVVLSLVLVGCSSPEPAEGNASSVSGEVFFNQRCAECHGLDGKASIAGATDLSASTLKDEDIKDIIENGKNGMPPFKIMLDSEEVLNNTIEHVKSLRK